MFLRRFEYRGFVALLVVVGLMLAGGGAWAAHDCCQHPPGANEDAGTETQNAADDDCIYACCQAVTAISPVPDISFQFDSWWSVEGGAASADSRFETDIFRPPLA